VSGEAAAGAVRDKILVVEDEPVLLETLEYNLTRQGYQVVTAEDGRTALGVARAEQPDLIVLDIMLPGIDGLEVCRILRQEMPVPILMLTARADEIDKVVGLEVGADDYMTKPFSMRELMARVKAMLRRVRLISEQVGSPEAANAGAASIPTDPAMKHGDLVVDPARRRVLVGGDEVTLSPKEFDLLTFLVRHPGIVLTRDLILERVWGWTYEGGSRTVDVHVRWLREKIETDPANPERITTVRGVGYRFEG
jgi:DNA-binding response OmpR family regulator